MSYRTFLDSQGRRWEVWLVTPAAAERRRIDRRAAAGSPGNNAYTGELDRRRTPDRRPGPFRRAVSVSSEYTNGWLCFESTGEKRRLAPIPEG
ncbi:MAG: hypothetical protein ABI408_02775 [Gemmatimonadaceae bacterium]